MFTEELLKNLSRPLSSSLAGRYPTAEMHSGTTVPESCRPAPHTAMLLESGTAERHILFHTCSRQKRTQQRG